MLWRANGYANTTVADICRGAGVSKALFYFYFPRKEDVLFEFGVESADAAHQAARAMLATPYEVADVIAAILTSLESSMRRNSPELVIQAIVEGYRRVIGEGTEGTTRPEWMTAVFHTLFERASADGKLPAHIDTTHLAMVAQSLVSEGARRWAAGDYGERSFAEVVGRDIAALVAGYGVLAPPQPPVTDRSATQSRGSF